MELPRTYSGSSARVDYRRRLKLNTQDSDEDVLFRQEMRYPERGAASWSCRESAARRRRFSYAEKMCEWRLQAKLATCTPSTIGELRSPS